ncbi:unnamed protein product [Rhizoctonia solani]|uniref:Uncharacterized protein n=1 Tax=Rhizoctonia solani TaxID=456999 RepID=A0A8H3BW75_9AGAM|nr:unnamed protein product [Rhizoctonia solani]
MQFALIVPALTFALGFYPLLIDALPIDLNIEARAYIAPNPNGPKLTKSNKIIISTVFGSFFLCYCGCSIACRRRKRRGQGRQSSCIPHRTSAGGTTTSSANNARRTRRARRTENEANNRSARSTRRTNGDCEPVPGSTMSLPRYNERVQDGEFVLLGQMRGVHDDEVHYNPYADYGPSPGAPQVTVTATGSLRGDTNPVENPDIHDPLRSPGPGIIINTNDSSIDITDQAYDHTDTGVHTFDTLAHTSSAAALPHGGLPAYEKVTTSAGTTDTAAIPGASRAEEG